MQSSHCGGLHNPQIFTSALMLKVRAGAFPSLVKGAASSEPCPAPVKLLPGLGSVQKSEFRLMLLCAVTGLEKV